MSAVVKTNCTCPAQISQNSTRVFRDLETCRESYLLCDWLIGSVGARCWRRVFSNENKNSVLGGEGRGRGFSHYLPDWFISHPLLTWNQRRDDERQQELTDGCWSPLWRPSRVLKSYFCDSGCSLNTFYLQSINVSINYSIKLLIWKTKTLKNMLIFKSRV